MRLPPSPNRISSKEALEPESVSVRNSYRDRSRGRLFRNRGRFAAIRTSRSIDSVRKTTILFRLKFDETISTIPTVFATSIVPIARALGRGEFLENIELLNLVVGNWQDSEHALLRRRKTEKCGLLLRRYTSPSGLLAFCYSYGEFL